MRVTEKLVRPVTEVKYLNADNAERYRSIMRIFFENYERLRYWMELEEVHAAMVSYPYFETYRLDQCQQDLTMRVEWKNLTTIQDTRNIRTIQEFQNKKFRYQLTPYSVEIERLVLRLENLQVEGASLEPSLLERIRDHVARFAQMTDVTADEVHIWWEDLERDFERLNRNYQDYMRDLNSVRAEEMMRTQAFLVFKDKLVEYLRNFVKSLQSHVGVIEENLRDLPQEVVDQVLDNEIDHLMAIPRLEQAVSRADLEEKVRGRYASIYAWFVTDGSGENEASRLFDATNEIIRRITRYAAQQSEQNLMGANRREEYRKVAELFLACEDVEAAHRMSAMVFGIARPQHLRLLAERESESSNKSVYEEAPGMLVLKPHVRTYREKAQRSAIRDVSAEKQQAREAALAEMKEDQLRIAALEKNGVIDLAALPVIESRTRAMLLRWLSDALEDSSHVARTEDGRTFHLELSNQEEYCVVRAEDGDMTLPHLRIVFEGER